MDGNINEKIGMEEPKKKAKRYSRLLLLLKLLGIYLLFWCVTVWLLKNPWNGVSRTILALFFGWGAYAWYIPVASIFYGIRTSIKRTNIITSSLLFFVVFEVVAIVLFCVFNIISNPGDEEWFDEWGGFALIEFIWMHLTLAASVLSLISGCVTKLVIHLNKRRKSKIQDNVA